MDSLDFKFLAAISGYASGVTGNRQFNTPLRGTFNVQLGNTATLGTGAYGDQGYFLVSYTLPAGAGIEIDLVEGGLDNLVRDPIEGGEAFSKVRFIAYKHEQDSESVLVRFGGYIVGGGTTGGETPGGAFGGLLTDPDGSFDLEPGELVVQGSPTDKGMAVIGEVTPNPTTPTRTTISVVNLDPNHEAVISVYVVGEKFGNGTGQD